MTTSPQAPIASPTNGEAVDPAAAELRAILRELRRQRLAIVGLATALIAFVTVGYVDLNGKAHDATLDRRALCTFRADLEARVASSRDFLVKHPAGFAGIPAATILKSIHDQERTIRALRALPCPVA